MKSVTICACGVNNVRFMLHLQVSFCMAVKYALRVAKMRE